jgi:NAD(P)-dependent dehydrogenase (short-subunit alcohol dehydrogenase family)
MSTASNMLMRPIFLALALGFTLSLHAQTRPMPTAQRLFDDAEWQRMFDVNIQSGVQLSRHYLPGIIARNTGMHPVHFWRSSHDGR